MQAITIGTIFGRTNALVRHNRTIALATAASLIALSLVFDRLGQRETMLFMGVATLFAQFFLTKTLLDRSGLPQLTDQRRLGAVWGALILTEIAVLLGSALLIVPGLYLAARWMIVVPAVIRDEGTIIDAMRKSWSATSDSVWQIMAALLLVWAPAFAALFGFALVAGIANIPEQSLLVSIATNLVTHAAFVYLWISTVAVYAAVEPNDESLAAIFA